MNKIKIVFMALIMGLFVQPVMAETSTTADLAYAFGASTNMLQIDLMTAQDMKAVKGEWGPFILAVYAVASPVASRSLVTALVSRAASAASVYYTAKHYGDR